MTAKHAKSMLHQLMLISMKNSSELDLCDGLCTHVDITYHSILDGLPENSVYNCAQTVAMASKHAISRFVFSTNSYLDSNFSQFRSHATACSRVINITSHTTVDGLPESSV